MLAREREADRVRVEAEGRKAMLALADGFEASVRHVVESVGASAKQIEDGAAWCPTRPSRAGN